MHLSYCSLTRYLCLDCGFSSFNFQGLGVVLDALISLRVLVASCRANWLSGVRARYLLEGYGNKTLMGGWRTTLGMWVRTKIVLECEERGSKEITFSGTNLRLLIHATTLWGYPHIAAGIIPNCPLVSTTLSRFKVSVGRVRLAKPGSRACPLITKNGERRRKTPLFGFHS